MAETARTTRPAIRAPMAPVAAALACGIVAGRYAPVGAYAWLATAAAAVVLAVATFRRPAFRAPAMGAVLLAVAALGAAHFRLAYFAVADDDLSTYAPARGRIFATIRGQVVTVPQGVRRADLIAGYRPEPRTAFVLQAEHVQTGGDWQAVSGRVQVTADGVLDALRAGQRVELVGLLSRPRPPDNPGQYDWSAAARAHRVTTAMTVGAAEGVIVRDEAPLPWYARAYWHVRAAARQHWSGCADEEPGQLLNALVLGERHPALRELNRAMVRAGIAHFLSISGLHLGIFVGIIYFLCRLATMERRAAAWVVLAVLAAYLVLAEARAPLLRSAVMAACLCAAVILRRQGSMFNALAVAAVVLLAMDPVQLFDAGFQLSFTIVAGLILLHRHIRYAMFDRQLRRRGLMVFRREHRVRRWWHFVALSRAMDVAAVIVTAALAAIPLTAAHFGLFSPYAPLLGVVVFPLVVAVLVPGYVSLALQWPMPNLAESLARLAGQAATLLARVVDAFSALPGLTIPLRPVPWWWVLLCYAALLAVLAARRTRWRWTTTVAAVLVVGAATFFTQRAAGPPNGAELHLLAVGDGQCAVLRTPSGRTWLIDAGTRSGYDAAERVLVPFLLDRKFPAPSGAFVSHANSDHYNALPGCRTLGAPQDVYVNDYFGASDGLDAPSFLLRLLREDGSRIVRLRGGQSVRLDDRTTAEVLWPPADLPGETDPNDRSLVLRIVCDGRSFLLPGDIDSLAQGRLLASGASLRADVLVLPHHGGWRATLPAFVRAVAPRVVLCSAGREPRPPHAAGADAARFYAELRASGRFHGTPKNGWICVRLGPDGVSVRTMR
ncbi:MAG TPA: hypothetical protein DCX07_15500 [Phycisphaerales bacterium]|nr:hypothetical protein [Phycisphaerales bacterium]